MSEVGWIAGIVGVAVGYLIGYVRGFDAGRISVRRREDR